MGTRSVSGLSPHSVLVRRLAWLTPSRDLVPGRGWQVRGPEELWITGSSKQKGGEEGRKGHSSPVGPKETSRLGWGQVKRASYSIEDHDWGYLRPPSRVPEDQKNW